MLKAWAVTGHRESHFRAHDREILSAVAQVRQDAIVVLVGGSSFTMEDWIGQTGALLMAYYPAWKAVMHWQMFCLARKIQGGKLPFVIPQSGADLPQVDWSATQQEYLGLAGYRKLLAGRKTAAFSVWLWLVLHHFCTDGGGTGMWAGRSGKSCDMRYRSKYRKESRQ